MALRYALPNDTILPSDDQPLIRLPALRAPVDLEYRSHEDTNGLNAILAASHCRIIGRTGVGKSSVLPKILATRSGCTVLVVTAHPLLSAAGYEFFETNPDHVVSGTGLRGTLLRDSATDLRDYDIVWSSAATLVSWILSRKIAAGGDKPLDGLMVFLDEAHECDAYTHVIRTMSLQLGARSLMLVSATFEPAGHYVNNDRVGVIKYPAELSPDNWDIHDSGTPWFHGNIKDSAIMFIDSDTAARRICKDLTAIGYVPHRLTARSTYKAYHKAVMDLSDSTKPPVVLILDRSYRSGFNFDVSLIIDSGILYYVDGEIGKCGYLRRNMFNVEYVQTAGRGGRFRRHTDYYYPDVPLLTKICDLEPAEMEGAALMTRLMGYLPVRETADTVMTYDNIPAHQPLLSVVNGCMPLSYYCRDKFGARKQGVRPVVIPEIIIKPVSVVSERRASSRITPRPAIAETVCSAVPSVVSNVKSVMASTFVSPYEDESVVSKSRRDSGCYMETRSVVMPLGSVTASRTGTEFEDTATNVSKISRNSRCDVKPSDSVSNLGTRVSTRDTHRKSSVSSSTTIELPRHAATVLTVPASSKSTITKVTRADDIWNKVVSALDTVEVEVPSAGAYIRIPEIEPTKLIDTSRHFPNGVSTVLDLVTDKKLAKLWESLPSHHRKYGLYTTVTRYNTLNMELNSLKEALTTVFSGSLQVLSNRPVKERITRILAKASAWEMERSALYTAIKSMAGSKFTVDKLHGTQPSEGARVLLYERKLRSIRDKRFSDSFSLDDWLGQENVLSPLMISDKPVKRRDRSRSKRREDSDKVKTVYVKPCLGVSRLIEHPGGDIDVIPSRLMRRMSGCSKVTISDMQPDG